MNRLKCFLILILVFPLLSKSQDYCQFIQKIQNYQDSVKLKPVGDYVILDSNTFDIQNYLSFFNNVEIENGIKIDIYFFDNFHDGNPYLYALKNNKTLDEKNRKSLYKFLIKTESRAKNHIIPKDSEYGYLQYLFFAEMGEQFALKWHSSYKKKRIICSTDQLSNVIYELSESEMFSADSIGLFNLKNVSPNITIERNENDFNITWLENRTHSGIYRCSYEIERKKPYNIVKVKEEKLLEIYLHFIY